MSHINPYQLLGVNTNSTISELKKNYYNLALICHPDRGGEKEEMQMLHSSYKYVLEQLNGIRNDTYEDAENELKEFYQQQKDQELPTFYNIHLECNEWLQKFNQEFESLKIDENELDPFKDGYGDLMDNSELSEDYTDIINQKPKNTFVTDIIEYKEPNSFNNFITKCPVKGEKISDFSCLDGNINMNDYKNAFSDFPEIKVDKAKFEGDVLKKYEIEIQARTL